jgi:hypothetical protein
MVVPVVASPEVFAQVLRGAGDGHDEAAAAMYAFGQPILTECRERWLGG